MKKIILVIVGVLLLSSCVKEYEFSISPQEKNIFELATDRYSLSELYEIISFDGNLRKIHSQYPIECIREDEAGYRVSYLGEAAIAMIIFDSGGNKINGMVYSCSMNQIDFDNLSSSNTLSDVQRIDPEGAYLFLSTGQNDTPKQSTHCTSEGYLITIYYDETLHFKSMNVELI